MTVVRATVATCLQAEGHLVVTAADGEEAMELLRNELTPFAIILDPVMPRKNGFQFRMAQMNEGDHGE